MATVTGYWLTLEQQHDGQPNVYVPSAKQKWRVRYTTPGLGFAVDQIVDGDTASMLKAAIMQGKEEKMAELRQVIGVK